MLQPQQERKANFMGKPQIKITLVDRIGPQGCHRGHKIGDSFDYDTGRGNRTSSKMQQANRSIVNQDRFFLPF